MEITEVHITIMHDHALAAFADVVLDDAFRIKGIKIIRQDSGYLIAMPNRKCSDGLYRDIAHPIKSEFRKRLEKKILYVFFKEMGEEI